MSNDNAVNSAVTSTDFTFSPNRERIFQELAELISHYSPHSMPEHAATHEEAAKWVTAKLEELGLDVTRHPTVDDADTIIGVKEPVGDAPTVLLYSHYDVVPAQNPAVWTNDPLELDERGGRWYGRGAADCKGNVIMHLAALRMVQENGGTDLGIKVVVEGSEELGGEDGLGKLIDANPELFTADVIFIGDGGNVAVGIPTLTTHLRGGAQLRIKVDTLEGPVHSGGWGGAAPDAAHALIRISDSFFDEHGRTTIEGVDTTAKWEGDPYDRETFRKDARVLDGVQLLGTVDDEPADMVWARPAITVIGFTSVPVKDATNIVNSTAEAQFNLRVPAPQSAAEVAKKVEEQIYARAPWGAKVEVSVTGVNEPFSTDPNGPAVQHFGKCMQDAYGAERLTVVGTGGSIPLTVTLQKHFPDAEFALYGVADPAANIHGIDESVDPTEIEHVAIAEATFLLTYGK
ncbi:Succinyl-diaminopimelate desuccinylase [Corynebacterium glaucum]|uniref:Succinyl-diaminopimelate desuccinylase n=1 Tax=Corynebacterium glaucum TaxID=187491 RepID=A0A1Q2HZ35_9CORY|nr:M20/M25/M40 family metallo-hydrolase [Corynebacterium glaucum]AQQ16112.1 Succinyl-diaminopimelate desuccinylase [Corynebacterium glaucum]